MGSGVVRDDDGVDVVFLGNIEGDRDEARTSVGGREVLAVVATAVVVAAEASRPSVVMIDIRFILRVSVGLMVRAPRPLAWVACARPGATDMRLADDD